MKVNYFDLKANRQQSNLVCYQMQISQWLQSQRRNLFVFIKFLIALLWFRDKVARYWRSISSLFKDF